MRQTSTGGMRTAGIALIALCTLGATEKFVPLFDGRTLGGWKQLNGTTPNSIPACNFEATSMPGRPRR